MARTSLFRSEDMGSTPVRVILFKENMNKKSIKLGMSHSTANYRLLKMILFMLLKELNKDVCYRCNKKIENIKELSIEHKIAWLNAKNSKELFFDLNNIAFSHNICNCKHTTKPKHQPWLIGENNPCAKLNQTKVNDIRKLLNKKETLRSIAKKYGVVHQVILRIKQGKNWNQKSR